MAIGVGLPDASQLAKPLLFLAFGVCCCCCPAYCVWKCLRGLVKSSACRKATALIVLFFALCWGAARDDIEEYFNGDPFKGRPPPGPSKSTVASPAVKEGFLEFPKDFVWGAATAAYQIEGAAAEGGRGPSIWDDITHSELLKSMGVHFQTGDVADDHYHRFRDDVALMAKLGFNAYRLSISWSRVIPDGDQGPVNEEGVKFYNDLFDEMGKRKIDPWVTLFHWDLPSGINQKFGGLLGPKEKIVAAFSRYARLCFERFGDRVKHWITLNEPFVVAFYYMPGIGWPKRVYGSAIDPYTAAHNMLLCHANAVGIYRKEFAAKQGGKIGITLNSDFTMPLNPDSKREVDAVQRARDFQIGWFADPVYFGDYPASMREAAGWRLPKFTPEETALIKNSSDFFGLNNYFTTHAFPAPESFVGRFYWKLMTWCCNIQGPWAADRAVITKDDPEWEHVTTGTGWPIVPWGHRDLLLYIQEHYNPPGGIAVTENGCSYEEDSSSQRDQSTPGALEPQPYKPGSIEEDWDSETFDDPRRLRYFKHYLTAVHAARARGADVRAYFAWSFMDNFEWLAGYKMRFGIVRVDYPTQRRTIKASGRFYADVIKNNGFEAPPLKDQYPGRPF